MLVRPIQPSDAAELRRAFRALSPETRYRRFFGAITDLDDKALEYLTNVDGRDHVAFVATTESLDLKSEVGIGVARFVRSKTDDKVAEVAVTVVDDMQRGGVGTMLMRALVGAARERGIERFRCEVLESNEVVIRTLLDVGAVIALRGEGAVILDIPIADLERLGLPQ